MPEANPSSPLPPHAVPKESGRRKAEKMFGCGAELITRVKHTIAQKADSDSAKRKKEHQKQQCFEGAD